MGTRCKASAFPQRLGSLRLPHFPQTRRRNYLQTINQGVGPFYSIGVGSFYVIEASGEENTMKTDRTTKVLLALIAMALFLNAIVPLAQPAVVQAQSGTSEIRLSQIFNELRQISTGYCLNDKIC